MGSGQMADEDDVTDVAVESEAGLSEDDKEFTDVNTEWEKEFELTRMGSGWEQKGFNGSESGVLVLVRCWVIGGVEVRNLGDEGLGLEEGGITGSGWTIAALDCTLSL